MRAPPRELITEFAMRCPHCGRLVLRDEDLCLECDRCAVCCGCDARAGAGAFDRDELGIDPETDEEG